MREQTIECSERLILACYCGEQIVLIGRAVDWYDEERLHFLCECGNTLTLDDSLPEDWTLFKSFRRFEDNSTRASRIRCKRLR